MSDMISVTTNRKEEYPDACRDGVKPTYQTETKASTVLDMV